MWLVTPPVYKSEKAKRKLVFGCFFAFILYRGEVFMKTKKIMLLIVIIVLIVGCKTENSEIKTVKINLNPEIYNENAIDASSRTFLPSNITENEISYIQLKGTYAGSEEKVLGTWNKSDTKSALVIGSEQSLLLDVGSWNFVMSAYINDTLALQVRQNEEITESTTTLSFLLKEITGQGSIKITANIPEEFDDISYVTAGLLAELSDTEFIENTEQHPTITNSQAVYELSEIETGCYWLIMDFYTAEGGTCKANLASLVYVKNCICTEGSWTIERLSVLNVAVTGVSLSATTLALNSTEVSSGTTKTITATIAPTNATNQNVIWAITSDTNSILTSVDNGVVTFSGTKPAAGASYTATVTATAEDTTNGTKSANCTITITTDAEGGSESETVFWRTDDYETQTITSEIILGPVTALATADKTMSISTTSISSGDYTFSKCLSLGGGGTIGSYRTLQFDVSEACTIRVYALSSSTSETRTLNLSDGSTVLNAFTVAVTGSTVVAQTYDYTGTGGTLYLYSGGSGINVYAIGFTASGSAAVSGPIASLYPASTSTGAFIDGDLEIKFNSEPTLESGGKIYIYSNGSIVDTINFVDETQAPLSGYTVNVGAQLVRKDGNSVCITPHFNKLSYSTTYYVVIPSGAITIGGSDFTELTNTAGTSWAFTTKSSPSIGTTVTVDGSQDSTAQFRTIYGAMYALNAKSGTYVIDVAAGEYYELVHYKTSKANTIIIHGPSNTKGDTCTIKYINCNDMNSSTHTRAVFYCSGANLRLENITIQNAMERNTSYLSSGTYSTNSQAEAIYFANGSGKTLVAYNSSFKSHQDTIQTTGKAWFYNCYIEGDVDYIWGTSDVCLLENCTIQSLYDSASSSARSYLFETRVGNNSSAYPTSVFKGYVLYNSTVNIPASLTQYYGRRATSVTSAEEKSVYYYDQVALVNVAFTGSGTLDAAHWYKGNDTNGLTGTKYGNYVDVGWKEYGVTVNGSAVSTSGIVSDSGVMGDTQYSIEYSGRRTILNRYYNTSSDNYALADSSTYWDIDALISERGYTVVTDNSAEDGTAADETNYISASDTPTGWASYTGTTDLADASITPPDSTKGTVGGYGGSTVTTVSTRSELLSALNGTSKKIIYIDGMIDMTEGMMPTTASGTTTELDSWIATKSSNQFASFAAYKAWYASGNTNSADESGDYATVRGTLSTAWGTQIKISIPSNTTIIGLTSSSGIKGGCIKLSGVSNVVIRNLTLQDSFDPFPQIENGDGFNANYDVMEISNGCKYIWIDHCTMQDTIATSDDDFDHQTLGDGTNLKYQVFDGLCDIKQASDFITVSYCKFYNHDKTQLIGHSSSYTDDRNHQTITLHHNYYLNCAQRLPMVRFATIHIYNNVYELINSGRSNSYAVGLREENKAYVENNYFGTGITATSTNDGSYYLTGNTGCSDGGSKVWTPSTYYSYSAAFASDAKTDVTANAGAGVWTVIE